MGCAVANVSERLAPLSDEAAIPHRCTDGAPQTNTHLFAGVSSSQCLFRGTSTGTEFRAEEGIKNWAVETGKNIGIYSCFIFKDGHNSVTVTITVTIFILAPSGWLQKSAPSQVAGKTSASPRSTLSATRYFAICRKTHPHTTKPWESSQKKKQPVPRLPPLTINSGAISQYRNITPKPRADPGRNPCLSPVELLSNPVHCMRCTCMKEPK